MACFDAIRIWTLVLVATIASQVVGQEPSEDSAVGKIVVAESLPQIIVVPQNDPEDKTEYARMISKQADELADQVEQTNSTTTKCDIYLAAANLILAKEMESQCARLGLGLSDNESADEDRLIRDAFQRADNFLEKATSLREKAAGQDSTSEGWLLHSEKRLSIVDTFAGAMREALLGENNPESVSSARRAASKLAILLEEDDEQVVAAATFWYALLRSRDKDVSVALSTLPLALADVKRKELPFAFYSRLLRCRLMARQGAYASALAILTRMEERSETWFARDKNIEKALRAIAAVQFGIIKSWQNHLVGPDKRSQRDWCSRRIQQLSKDRFPEGKGMVYRFSPAIPIVMSPDDVRREPQDEAGEQAPPVAPKTAAEDS